MTTTLQPYSLNQNSNLELINYYCTGISKIKNDKKLSHPPKKIKNSSPRTISHRMFSKIKNSTPKPDKTGK